MDLGNLIARGNTAEIFLSNNKIIKVFNDYLPDSEADREANKQKLAYSCGLPVPKVFEVTKIKGRQAIIMEYVEGDTLGDLFNKDKEQTEQYLTISVDLQLEIHRTVPENIESMYDKLSYKINRVNVLGKKQKEYLLNKMESFTYNERLCHGDFHLYNVIMRDGQAVVIDWVDSCAGDIHADVYRSYLLYFLHVSEELAERYLQIYCEKSGVFKSEVLKWAPIIAAARVAENVSLEETKRLKDIIDRYIQN